MPTGDSVESRDHAKASLDEMNIVRKETDKKSSENQFPLSDILAGP